jgi:hypothetical protein
MQRHSVAPPTDQIGFRALAAWCGFQPRGPRTIDTLVVGAHSLLSRTLEQPFVCVTLMWASIVVVGSLSSEGARGRLREASASSYKTKAYSRGAPSKVTLHPSPVTLRRSSQPGYP